MEDLPFIRRDLDGLPFRPSFTLISPPTLDLMEALNKACNGSWSIDEAIKVANEALDAGADPCPPPDLFNFRMLPIAIWVANTPEKYKSMRPLIERLIVAADQESLDRSLDELVGCGSPKKFKTTLAKQLQSFGAQFSNGVLSNLSISLASCSDTQGAARVAQLRDLGWKPQDLRGEGDIMKDILQGRMLKTLDVWVGIYETYNHPLPDTEDMSCMIFLSQKQQQFKNKAETFTKMAERMLLSGLVGWQDGHFQDWKKNAPAWILETAVEGDKRRLDRQTQTPVNINPNRKYRI